MWPMVGRVFGLVASLLIVMAAICLLTEESTALIGGLAMIVGLVMLYFCVFIRKSTASEPTT